jgi:hypothetical protein
MAGSPTHPVTTNLIFRACGKKTAGSVRGGDIKMWSIASAMRPARPKT